MDSERGVIVMGNPADVIDYVPDARNAPDRVDGRHGEFPCGRSGKSDDAIPHIGLHGAEAESSEFLNPMGNDPIDLSRQLRVWDPRAANLDPVLYGFDTVEFLHEFDCQQLVSAQVYVPGEGNGPFFNRALDFGERVSANRLLDGGLNLGVALTRQAGRAQGIGERKNEKPSHRGCQRRLYAHFRALRGMNISTATCLCRRCYSAR